MSICLDDPEARLSYPLDDSTGARLEGNRDCFWFYGAQIMETGKAPWMPSRHERAGHSRELGSYCLAGPVRAHASSTCWRSDPHGRRRRRHVRWRGARAGV